MDPNETLKDIRWALDAYFMGEVDSSDSADALFPAVSALDEWLSGGGFLPDAWRDR